MVQLREITRENYMECINLKVAQAQQHFVASNAFSLAQAAYQNEYVPLAIYNGEQMVGFLMHGIDSDDDQHWICRLMVAQQYQKSGYGRAAMCLIMQKIQQDKARNKILISFEPDNSVAQNLYASLGFRHTGKVIEGETVMQYDY